MTQEEKLTYCKVCLHRKMNISKGLVCSLTNKKPSFDAWCPDYDADQSEVDHYEEREALLSGVDQSHDTIMGQKGINKSVISGLIMISIASAWFFFRLLEGGLYTYPSILFVAGILIFGRGISQKSRHSRKSSYP